MALTGGAHDAGEHLLSIGAVAGAVATTHLAGDDSGPNGLFGAPELVASTVRSRRKRNTASNSVRQVPREALGVVQRWRCVNQLWR